MSSRDTAHAATLTLVFSDGTVSVLAHFQAPSAQPAPTLITPMQDGLNTGKATAAFLGIPLKGLKLHQLGPGDLISCYFVIPLLAVINFGIKKEKTHTHHQAIYNNLDAIKPSLGRILLHGCSPAFLAHLWKPPRLCCYPVQPG